MKLDVGEKKWLIGCAIWIPMWCIGLILAFTCTPWIGVPLLVFGFGMNIRLMWRVMSDY